MLELISVIYLSVFGVLFVVLLFTQKRMEGRVRTGEPDVLGALSLACLWPLVLVLFVYAGISILQEKRES